MLCRSPTDGCGRVYMFSMTNNVRPGEGIGGAELVVSNIGQRWREVIQSSESVFRVCAEESDGHTLLAIKTQCEKSTAGGWEWLM